MTFSNLNLIQPLLDALHKSGYEKPSPIQQKAIPLILAGEDIMAAAQTGTGKTAGFALPMLQRLSEGKRPAGNSARSLILAPTRELAEQVHQSVQKYAANLSLKSMVVYGGVKINPQMLKLRKGTDVLVATPGRLLDLMEKNAVRFDDLELLVLDEADRMLDMGFLPSIKRIIGKLPKQRQTLLFSATFSESIKKLSQQFLNNPKLIETETTNTTASTVKQWIHPVDKKQKAALLSHLIEDHRWHQLLVFVRTRRGANRLSLALEKRGIKATSIHGGKSQNARNRALQEFKSGKVHALVATDVAARGLDIDQMPVVVNYDLPNVAEDYVHRIGRTGRAGEKGHAISLVSADEVDDLKAIQNLIQKQLERRIVDDFEPIHSVPETDLKAAKKKKPHKKKLAKAKLKESGKKSGSNKDKGSQPKRGKNGYKGKSANKGKSTVKRKPSKKKPINKSANKNRNKNG
ncbi:DEAD/DEAH box helicase [Kangiella sediminilitoris]|uniref:DEAD-box ATP-dependent RNA helicase RhpA n=1 Tax=Kangiella sediminilitoris TaxID=1144748 RepID=A0A1B3BDL5_9GAMM|nr:DEAD/DEAH box helicase [Kangiella sediminilitoris]AOE50924.1 DEAD/DEAH box helicase domain protein [Kangiella sediminilitoris]